MTTWYDTVWSEALWFPKSVLGIKYGWKDLENDPSSNIYLPQPSDLHWSLIIGLGLVILRYFLERFVISPMGYRFGVRKQTPIVLEPSPLLEAAYRRHCTITKHDIQALSKQQDLTVRQVERWWRNRRKLDGATPIKKFCDNCWHLGFYSIMFVYGVVILWDKTWLWKTEECWKGWPKQHVSTDIYVFYMTELAFYWSLIFTLFTDHKRKDFKELIVHHVATILLMYFSWLTNFVRVGTLVLLAHDAADPWLGMSKMWRYLHKQTIVEVSFVIFTVVWIISRLTYYPFWVLYTTTFESLNVLDMERCPIYFTFNILLYTLMVLHILWSCSIYKIIYNVLYNNKLEDVRSDSE